MTIVQHELMTVEEYMAYELQAEERHEYIDGQIIEMAGEKAINNSITLFLSLYFYPILSERGYNIYSQVVKVIIPGGSRIYYPDWFVTRELITEKTSYIQYEPEMIVEVVSRTSRKKDNVDKYLDYVKIPSLKYYLIIDPEKIYVTVHFKGEDGEWEADAYNERTETIPLPLLETQLPLSIIYR